MATNWFSNLASNVKNTFADAGLGRLKSPVSQKSLVSARVSAPSTPRTNWSSKVKTSFDQGLTKFKQNTADNKIKLKQQASDLYSSFDKNPNKAGVQLFKAPDFNKLNPDKAGIQLFKTRDFTQNQQPSKLLKTAANAQDFLTRKLPSVPLVGQVLEGPIKVAENLGKTAIQVRRAPAVQEQAVTDRNTALQLRADAKLALKEGNIDESRKLANQAYQIEQASANKQIKEGETNLDLMKETAAASVRTYLESLGFKKLASLPVKQLALYLGLPTLLGAGVGALQKENPLIAGANALGNTPKMAGLNVVTGPVIDPLIGWAGKTLGSTPMSQFLAKTTMAGLTNIGEDVLYNWLGEARKTEVPEMLMSFVTGAGFGGVQAGNDLIQIKNLRLNALETGKPGAFYQKAPGMTLFPSKKIFKDASGILDFAKNTTPEKYNALSPENKANYRRASVGLLTQMSDVNHDVINKMSTPDIIEELGRQATKQIWKSQRGSIGMEDLDKATPTGAQLAKLQELEDSIDPETTPRRLTEAEAQKMVEEARRQAQGTDLTVKNDRFGTTQDDLKLIESSDGKIDAERLYLLKQEAELYPTAEKFIKNFGDSDLSKTQLADIYNQANKTKLDIDTKAETDYQKELNRLKQERADLTSKYPDDYKSKEQMQDSFKFNALQRAIDLKPTQAEIDAALKKLNTNFIGKTVTVPEFGEGIVVGTTYGKTQVEFPDGTKRSFDPKTFDEVKVTEMDAKEFLKEQAQKQIDADLKTEQIIAERQAARDAQSKIVQPEPVELTEAEAKQMAQEAVTGPARDNPQAVNEMTQELSPDGKAGDVVEETAPQTVTTKAQKDIADFQAAQRALRENGENVKPQADETTMAEANKRLFGEDEGDLKPPPQDLVDEVQAKTAAQTQEPTDPTIPAGMKERKTYRSMLESEYTPKEFKQMQKDNPDRLYIPKSMEEVAGEANKVIEEKGLMNVVEDFMQKGINLNNDQDMATALIAYNHLLDSGDLSAAKDLFSEIAFKQTASGRNTNWAKLIDYMSPAKLVDTAENYIDGGKSRTKLREFMDQVGITPDAVKLKDEANGLLDALETKFNSLETPEAKADFLKNLIDENKIIKRTMKNKQGFIDQIVKLSEDPKATNDDFKEALLTELNIPHMTKDFADYIMKTANEIKKMPDGDAKNKLSRELLKQINSKIPLSFAEAHRAYRYNNVLSGLGTHERNLWENILKVLVFEPARIAKDQVIQGKFLKAVTEPIQFYSDLAHNLSLGTEGFKKAMKGEIYPEKMTLESERAESYRSWLTITRRLLEGEDQLFSQPLLKTLNDYHLRQGMDPVEANKLALIETNEALYKGAYDPENKTRQGWALSEMDKIAMAVEGGLRKFPMGDRLVMFPRIATKITKAGLEYSPLGYGTIPGHRNTSDQVFKASLGTIAMMTSYLMAAQDKTRGQAPSDKKAKEAFYDEGPAWTVQLGNKNVPMKYFASLALSLKMGTFLYDFLHKSPKMVTESNLNKLLYSVIGLLSVATDETYMQGIKQGLDAISNIQSEDTYALNKLVGQNLEQEIIFSGFLAWANRFHDPVKRKGEGVLDTAVRRMPIFSKGAEYYTSPDGTPATSGYGEEGLAFWNNLRPYDITPVKPENREIIDSQIGGQIERAKEKAEEAAGEPTYWDRLNDVSAAEFAGTEQATSVPKITTTDQLTKEEPEKEGFFSKLFGKKDKEIETVYNPGDIIKEVSNKDMDVVALPGGQTFKVPKSQAPFTEKYEDVVKILANYEEDRNDILYDDTLGEIKQQNALNKLEAEYQLASTTNQILKKQYPEMVFDAEISTYGSDHPSTVLTADRGEWAEKQLENLVGNKIGTRGSEEWQALVNKMWDGGVLTSASNGTVSWILENYPVLTAADFTYTGDDEKIAKKAKSISGGSGSSKKLSVSKIDVPSLPQISYDQVNISAPNVSAPDYSKLLVGSQGIPARPSSDWLKVKTPELSIPEVKVQRNKIAGL